MRVPLIRWLIIVGFHSPNQVEQWELTGHHSQSAPISEPSAAAQDSLPSPRASDPNWWYSLTGARAHPVATWLPARWWCQLLTACAPSQAAALHPSSKCTMQGGNPRSLSVVASRSKRWEVEMRHPCNPIVSRTTMQDKPGHPFYAKEKALSANIRNSWKIWLSRLSLQRFKDVAWFHGQLTQDLFDTSDMNIGHLDSIQCPIACYIVHPGFDISITPPYLMLDYRFVRRISF